jgi:ubiquitin carboxyl-terminal hydrolase 25
VELLTSFSCCAAVLQELVVMERSRGRFTAQDVNSAIRILGFGSDNLLQVDYENDLGDEFIEEAWKAVVKRSWKEVNGSDMQREATEALRVLAEYRGSRELYKKWDAVRSNSFMHPDRAYDVLEVPKDVDEAMLITVYSMRVKHLSQTVEGKWLTLILSLMSNHCKQTRCVRLCS